MAVNRFLPSEVPITVPGLGGLGPVTMEDATVTIERPSDVLQLGGWKLRIEDTVVFDLTSNDPALALTIELEWESEDDDFSPVVRFDVTTTGQITVADALQLAGMLASDAATADTLAGETSVSNFALSFHWDHDGPTAQTWFDVTGTTTFGLDDIAVSYLFSYDSGGPKGEHFITGVRVDNTDPEATTVSLGRLIRGDWGLIAGNLELPEFVVAKVSGLPDGVTIGRNNLRIGSIPLRFFTGCDACANELPEDFELDSTLTLLAKIDLAAFGDVVADAFDYPDDDSVVDLYGKLGLTFSSVEGADPVSLENAKLRADIPESGGLNSLLPDWLSVGAWTLTLEYDSDELVGGITVGARTTTSVDVSGDGVPDFVFDPTLATFTRTNDGTISVGVFAESNATWSDPFGVEWLDLTALGLGASYTKNANGQTAFDAALTSTFELCEPGCASPSVGSLEARLGVTDDAQVQFRIAFGEGDSTVPIGALLGPIAEQFGASPQLTGEIGDLELDDLVFAITVDTSGHVVFESFAAANLGFLGDITSYLYVEAGEGTPRFFFGARPSEGATLAQLLSPGTADPPAPDVLAPIKLPTLGIVAAPVGGYQATSTRLTRDGFEFFKPLYGCADAATPADCTFQVALDPGVNLVANITFPEELTKLAEVLWLDAEQGIQFQGTLSLPGVFDPGAEAEVKLGLRLTLPRLEPGDAVEFIEDGSLTLGIEAVLGSSPRIELYVEGLLNTRWRHGGEPLASGGTCPLRSVPMVQYEHPLVGEPNPTWCYDRLTFRVKSALTLTTGGVSVSLLGGLSAPEGWQHPFGVPGFEWLVINDVVVKLEVVFPAATGGVSVNVGFLGDIEVDNGEPTKPNTVLQASFSAGVTIQQIPGPPGVSLIPNFKGVRAYVSRIGMSDLAQLQQLLFPPEPGGDGLDLSSLPDVEFQNVEFMFSIGSDPDLCLEPRIGFAGELWIDPQRDGGGGERPGGDGPCRPFGADVDPAACLANRELGCFASVKATVGLDDIFAAGSVGEFDVGPVHWDGGLIDVRLKLGEAPLVAVSGGVSVEQLGSGRLAMRLELLPVAKVEFFGYLEAFGAYEVQVDGSFELRLDPLWPPELKNDMELHAALRADFESFLRNQVSAELRKIADSLDDLDEALELLARDPIGNLAEARDALAAAGVDLPDWVDGLIDAVEATSELLPTNAPLPTYDQLVGGEPYSIVTQAIRSCDWFDTYDSRNDTCRKGDGTTYAPNLWCIPPGALNASARTCSYTIELPDLTDFIGGVIPPTWAAALEDLYGDVVDAITDIDLVPNISGLGIEDYLYELSDQLADARFLTVDCAEFTWTAGKGAGEIDVQLLLRVLGEEYGFDVALDLTSTEAGVRTVVQELIELFLEFGEQDVTCTGVQGPPDWTAEIQGVSATPLTLALGPAGPVAEGQPVTVHGTIAPPASEPITIELTWGDGTSEQLPDVTVSSFEATHTYLDDNPTGTPADLYAVGASSAAATGSAFTTIEVQNAAPDVAITNLDDDGFLAADEGQEVTLTFTFDDVAADTHSAVVTWGDGSSTTLPAVQSGSPVTATHTYVDDNPSGTPFDEITGGIRVVVTDDDSGSTAVTADLRVSNVAPVVTFPDATVGADGVATVSVQYSDPLGGDPATGEIDAFEITARDVAADDLVLAASLDGAAGLPGWLQFDGPSCVADDPVHQRCTWQLSAVGDPVSGIHTDLAPGTYDLALTVTDDDTGAAGVTLRITVLPEDGRVWYQGATFAATESALSGAATVELRATVRDITSAVPPTDPEWDPWPGDIRTAQMTFVERVDPPASNPPTLCAAPSVDEVFSPFDVFDATANVGVGTCDWTASVPGDAAEHTVATVLGGNYLRNETDDDVVVTVARPLDDFITGGGYLVLGDSAGEYAGDVGGHANYGFHVKFNRMGTNLQGGANIIVRSGGRVYQIKSNSTTSLGVDGSEAQFEAKANLTDVTDEQSPVVIAGNLVLQMRMDDVSAENGQDVISFALWDVRKTGNGKHATTTQHLLFSSNWDGQQSALQQIAGGNLMVHTSRVR